MWVYFVFVFFCTFRSLLQKVNWHMILELCWNWLFSIIPTHFNSSLFFLLFFFSFLLCMVFSCLFFPTFLPLSHPPPTKGSRGIWSRLIFSFFHLEFTFLTILPCFTKTSTSTFWCLISDYWTGGKGEIRASENGAHFVVISYETISFPPIR